MDNTSTCLSTVQLLNLTPEIAIEATQLPQPFHRDPADQIIVATARIHGCQLLTLDGKIRNYPHVELLAANYPRRLG